MNVSSRAGGGPRRRQCGLNNRRGTCTTIGGRHAFFLAAKAVSSAMQGKSWPGGRRNNLRGGGRDEGELSERPGPARIPRSPPARLRPEEPEARRLHRPPV